MSRAGEKLEARITPGLATVTCRCGRSTGAAVDRYGTGWEFLGQAIGERRLAIHSAHDKAFFFVSEELCPMHGNLPSSAKHVFDVGIKLLLCNIQILVSLIS